MKYRREIDGLRAVAILPVMFFHAGFRAFKGGFIGVDVFFVISGYLITTIILSDMNKGRFSIVVFYERRARRILPALFFVMLCCLPFAWFWLSPPHLREFCQSLVAVSLFSSNALFWLKSGYFETAAELKPLLHTWSLAVEEQYYLLFPLFLLALWKLRKRWIFGTLIAVAVVSLIGAQWGAYNKSTGTFFLLPTRVWELAIGALIAFYFLYKKEQSELVSSHRVTSEVLGLLGLSLICYSIFAFDKSTPFPSIYALIPVIGTALIIIFSTSGTIAGRLISTKAMVGIGLISYSLYLWHLPLFVFARHRGINEPSVSLLLVLSFLSIILAYLSWRYVEMPFRDKQVIGRKNIFCFAAIGSLIFAATGLAGHLENGFEKRFTREGLNVPVFDSDYRKEFYREGTCFLSAGQQINELPGYCYEVSGSPSAMIWGDSHAAALSYGLRTSIEDVIQITASGCPPILGLEVDDRKECKDINLFAEEIIGKYRPKNIYLHANWLRYQGGLVPESLVNTIKRIIVKSPASKVAVVGGVPQWRYGLLNLMFVKKMPLSEGNFVPVEKIEFDELLRVDEMLAAGVNEYGVDFLSPINMMCENNNCQAIIPTNKGYELTTLDYGHLTSAGSILLANKILQHADIVW